MAQLAIKGHATRGKEVIEILEMLGGKNDHIYGCNVTDYVYSINEYGIIDWYIPPHTDSPFAIFTLEKFLEKFPYKVGDKVHHIIDNENQIITDLVWDEDEVLYKTTNNFGYAYVNYLQPYKEETMEEKNNDNWAKWDLPEGYEFQDKDGNIINTSVIRLVKKQLQYPKTYEECCKILDWNHRDYDRVGYNSELLCKLQVLLLCRDAYWKIAGEQMGLGKLWKPDWEKADERKYCIVNTEGNVAKWVQKTTNKILAFPTEEMRDAFYENFKNTIEQCKELL